ncbi:hypothetical protein [Variovorax sp. YR752]|uniref:hypothetical protein n=1 Tax=Variovorax sp. YR752 TaxID=1884383 RepID=UPI00313774E1
MAGTDTPTWDPASWLKQWTSAMQLAPNTLVQPILPGWTLNVNAFNSSSPQTEAEVLSKHSYGRQLGRISEALAVLVEVRDPKAADERFADFRTMKAEIDEIKAGNAQARVERLLADLDLLKVLDSAAHARLKDELKKRMPK